MRAMILTAGKGERLLPLSKKWPKPLFPVGDRPALLYLLDLLKEYGIKEVILNLHHLGDVIQKKLNDGSKLGLRINYSREKELLGTGGGVRKASSFWGKEDILVINGDNLIELNLEKLQQFHSARQPSATMVLKPRGQNSAYTPIYLDEAGQVKSVGGSHKSPAYAFLGVQVLSPEFVDRLPSGRPACLIEDGYLKTLRTRSRICGFVSTGYWKEFSTLALYWEVNQDFLKGKSPAYFYRGREEFTRRGIHAGKNSILGARVNFYYPVYFGDDCRIGAGSSLGPMVLVGEGSTIGENCRLENVLIWPGSKVKSGSRLKDIIVTPSGKLKIA